MFKCYTYFGKKERKLFIGSTGRKPPGSEVEKKVNTAAAW